MIEVVDAKEATKNAKLKFFSEICELQVKHLTNRNFWDVKTVKEVCLLIANTIRSFVKAPCGEDLGQMEENMRVGMAVFDVLSTIKEKHKIYDPSDVIIVGDYEYVVSDRPNNPLVGEGKFSGAPLSTIHAMTGGYKRNVQNRDMAFLTIMNFAGGMDEVDIMSNENDL